MKSKVHPTYKTKYRVANWPAYNRVLVRRGDVTLWLSSEAIAAWTPRRSGRRGGQRRYSDLAIETALTLRLIYHLRPAVRAGRFDGAAALLHEYPLRVGRRGPHFSRPSAGATLQGCSRRSIPRIRRSTALRTGRPTIRLSFAAAM